MIYYMMILDSWLLVLNYKMGGQICHLSLDIQGEPKIIGIPTSITSKMIKLDKIKRCH